MAIAILSFYAGIGVFYKIVSSFSPKKLAIEAVAPAKPVAVNEGVPALDSPAFDSFIGTPAFEALMKDGDQLAKLLESA